MAWIESHTVLSRHRKIIELSRELRLKPVYTMGHLHALWHAALEQQENGDLSSWTDEFIAESAQYQSDAPQFVRLLQKYGFLDGKIIHDWLNYTGLYLTKKYSTNDREKLAQIWVLHGKVYGTVNEKRTNSEQKANLPNLTKPNLTINTATDAACSEIIAYLNLKSGLKYSTTAGANLKFVRARLAEYSPADLQRVVDRKVAAWMGTEWQKFLRPETLFNATKFQGYVNEQDTKKKDDQWAKPFQG